MGGAQSPLNAYDAFKRLTDYPSLRSLQIPQITRFQSITQRLWQEIGVRADGILPELPQTICSFLSAILDLPENATMDLWEVMGPVIAQLVKEDVPPSDDDIFRVHGDSEIAAEIMYPPVTRCTTTDCKGRTLTTRPVVELRLYTLRRGVLPVLSKSSYCTSCHTCYYPDYSVTDASKPDAIRRYYSEDLKPILHVFESSFVEADLCVHFENQMAYSHASAENIARIYNASLTMATHIPQRTRLSQDLHADLVLDSFLLHALWRDRQARGQPLTLPHAGTQRARYNVAMDERNYQMAGTGQEMWSHSCLKCTKYWQGEDGVYRYISAGVTDGVTLGHPCCNIADCKERLEKMSHRYCPTHSAYSKVCSVHGCILPAETSHITCTTPSHREWEAVGNARKHTKSRKEQDKRAARAGVVVEPCEEPDASAEPKIKGNRYHRWTHNEQLMVRCCGVIMSRATFFGSEGVSGTKDFLKATFPLCYPSALLSYIFYDNNCKLLRHLRTWRDEYFKDCGLPIDAFHAKSHHEGDTFCQEHCLPNRFPELRDENGKWVFNSSAAEQVNIWFGAFQSIVREMPESRYTFYLDEMIAIRNRFIVQQLEKNGQRPYLIPEEQLSAPQS